MLTERDPWTPGMVNPKPNDRAYQWCCDAQNLYDNMKRLNLDVEKFVPIHDRVDTWEHFLEYLGKPPEKAAKDQKAGNEDLATQSLRGEVRLLGARHITATK